MDPTFLPLLPYIQQINKPTLWLADEHAMDVLANLSGQATDYLYVISNRYDVVDAANAKGIQATFNDFDLTEPSLQTACKPERILYRISKEKALVHYILNQCSQYFPDSELIISGLKQEGIKTYAQKLIQTSGAKGKLKKNGMAYSGCFTHFKQACKLDDMRYNELHTITSHHPAIESFISKPGVFGWQKIDVGTELLMQSLETIVCERKPVLSRILDLGCGYGWIFTSLLFYLSGYLSEQNENTPPITITATDNNAAALLAANANARHSPLTVDIVAGDCGNTLSGQYDLILCNPPFHQGFAHNKQLIEKFLTTIKRLLAHKGIAVLVVNEFIGLPKELTERFSTVDIITQHNGFKVMVIESL